MVNELYSRKRSDTIDTGVFPFVVISFQCIQSPFTWYLQERAQQRFFYRVGSALEPTNSRFLSMRLAREHKG